MVVSPEDTIDLISSKGKDCGKELWNMAIAARISEPAAQLVVFVRNLAIPLLLNAGL